MLKFKKGRNVVAATGGTVGVALVGALVGSARFKKKTSGDQTVVSQLLFLIAKSGPVSNVVTILILMLKLER